MSKDIGNPHIGPTLDRRRHWLPGLALAAATGMITLPLQAATLTAPQQQMLESADPSQIGKEGGKCKKCHGDNGVSDDDEVPHLAGLSAAYVFKQLLDFKADAREGGRMNKTARKLEEQEMANLAVLYSRTPLPAMTTQPAPPAPDLVSKGDPGRKIASCAECHGDDGRGRRDKYDAPALAGMPVPYFVTMMQAFRDGTRSNDPDAVMRDNARPLSDAEIGTLGEYYLALGQRLPQPPQ